MARRRKIALSKRRLQSALTNGKHLLANVDHRGAEMRRLKDCIHAHLNDMGGESNVSHSERVLIGRAAMLTLQLELMERSFAVKGGLAALTVLREYGRGINTLRRTLESLGLKRRARDITPTPEQYFEQLRREDAGEAAE